MGTPKHPLETDKRDAQARGGRIAGSLMVIAIMMRQ
jgi:hypothetical protein